MPAEKGLLKYFARPNGLAGALTGRMMAGRRMNHQRNLWAVMLLDPRPGDRVLEVGFGPGMCLELFAGLVGTGVVCGVDPSAVMLAQAERRNRRAVEQGRVRLFEGAADNLPDMGMSFNKVAVVNSYQFWGNGPEGLANLKQYMEPGGAIAIVAQPMLTGDAAGEQRRLSQMISNDVSEAGFVGVQLHDKDIKPNPAICVIAAKSG